LPEVSQKAEDACSEFARKTRHILSHERCEVIDPVTGEVFFDKQGLEYSVDLTELYWLHKDQCKGAILTHNHPKVELAFSEADMRTAAKLNLGQIRAVTGKFQHVLAAGERGWEGLFSMPFRNAMEMSKTLAHARLKGKYGDEFDLFTLNLRTGEADSMATDWVYETMCSFAESRGLRYWRIPND
jgi:proteasome lid subunit RPN8/RPN11